MCNLNILVRTSNASDETIRKIPSFMMATSSNSFITNDDGDGVYVEGLLMKSDVKLDIFGIAEQIMKSRFVITHQRIATSGFSTEFTQPFGSEDFVLAHNGIISSFSTGGKSDTYIFFERFNKDFKRLSKKGKWRKKTRQERIVKVLQKLLNGVSGSYSIVLYDKVDGEMYYFRNLGAVINIFSNEEVMYLTTNSDNEKFLPMFGDSDLYEHEASGYSIYRVCMDDLCLYEIGEIKQPQKKNAWGGFNQGGWYSGYDDRYYTRFSGLGKAYPKYRYGDGEEEEGDSLRRGPAAQG